MVGFCLDYRRLPTVAAGLLAILIRTTRLLTLAT